MALNFSRTNKRAIIELSTNQQHKMQLILLSATVLLCCCISQMSCIQVDCKADQIPTLNNQTVCDVTKTSVCSKRLWEFASSHNILKSRDDAPFRVFVTSYLLNESVLGPDTAYNITLRSLQVGVTGFAMFIESRCYPYDNYSSCRFFNCTGAKELVEFEYPCYKRLDIHGCTKFTISVFALPEKKGLRYQINLPHAKRLSNKSHWETTMMVNLEAIKTDSKVELQFQAAPPYFDVKHYLLRLINEDKPQKAGDTRTIRPDDDLHAVFKIKEKGNYYISLVAVYNSGEKSNETKSSLFHVEIETLDFTQAIIIGVICVLVILALIMALLLRKCLNMPGQVLDPRPKVLFLYGFDSEAHCSAVDKVARYFEVRGHCDVRVDSQDLLPKKMIPKNWVTAEIREVDYIIVVLSPMAMAAVRACLRNEGATTPLQTPEESQGPKIHPWDCLLNADMLRYVLSTRSTRKLEVIGVAWDSLNPALYQTQFKELDCSVYKLMSDLNELLCHLHKQEVLWFPSSLRSWKRLRKWQFRVMPGSDYRYSEEGMQMKLAIDQVVFAQ